MVEREVSASYLYDLVEGWQIIRRERVIFSLTVANALGNFIEAPLFAVALPVYADQVPGTEINLELMLGGAAVDALAGALLYGAFGAHLSRRWVYAGTWLVGTAPFWVVAGTPPLLITVTMLVLLGLTAGLINPRMETISRERTPQPLHGRVFGARTALANIAAPLGMLAADILIAQIGIGPTLLVMASIQTVVAGLSPHRARLTQARATA